jgi:hypothetical protein
LSYLRAGETAGVELKRLRFWPRSMCKNAAILRLFI